ncbi:MAG: hypothetical protein FWB93_02465 [Oscillospiraceae bacterium]|nr:hypothetical protein [Oscillospiraceae bacterium]
MKTIKLLLLTIIILSVLLLTACGLFSGDRALYQEARRVWELYENEFVALFDRNLEHFETILSSPFMERNASAGRYGMTFWSCPYGSDISSSWDEEQRNIDWMTDELYSALNAIFEEIPYAMIGTWGNAEHTGEIGLYVSFFDSERIEAPFRGRSSATFSFNYGRAWDEGSQIIPPIYLRNGWRIHVTSFWSS